MKRWLAMLSISTIAIGSLTGCMDVRNQDDGTPPPLEEAPDQDDNPAEGEN
ncbi:MULTISPECIES: hypothetical protein [Gracilibacillus]|uniref:hypothetical protein n=1 Tax=Gracilibacillus TaxID=74385 RepID=UPI000A74A912|nr:MULTISPECIES: hypothetical protein [Gracilibacillus]